MKQRHMDFVLNPSLCVRPISDDRFLIRDHSNGKFWKVSESVIIALVHFGLQVKVPVKSTKNCGLPRLSKPNSKVINELHQRGWILDASSSLEPVIQRGSPSYIALPFVMLTSGLVNKMGKYLKVLYNRRTFVFLFSLGVVLLINATINHRELTLQSGYLLPFVMFMFMSVFFHELGHTSALLYGGEMAGPIGGGFYLFTPVMFADVTNAWALKKRDRQRVNIGGIYFEMIFFVVFYTLFEITEYPELQNIIVLIGLKSFWNLNPLLRSDGYWLLSDALEVPNLYANSYSEWSKLLRRKKGNLSPILLLYGALSIVAISLGLYYTFRLSIFELKTWPKDLVLNVFKVVNGQEVKLDLTECFGFFPILILCYLLGKLLFRGLQKALRKCF